jgi:biopolymer transport protein ExbD
MKLTKHRRQTRARVDMTPMIDIVFLLIIFFMTVTQVSQAQKEPIDLPKLAGSEEQRPSQLTINVSKTGEAIVAGTPLTVSQIVSLVSGAIQQAGNNPDVVTIVIRADTSGTSRTVNQLVRSMEKLGVKRVRLATEVPR